MNPMIDNLNKYYEAMSRDVLTCEEPPILYAREVDYSLLKGLGFTSPVTYRLPDTVKPMIDALLPHTPYATKAELVYELLSSQFQALGKEFPAIDKALNDAAQEALDEFNEKHAEIVKKIEAESQEELIK